jgi:transposase
MAPDPAASAIPSFVPIITETAAAPSASAVTSAPPAIEVTLAGAVVRVSSGMDATTLTTVLRAVRASASRR